MEAGGPPGPGAGGWRAPVWLFVLCLVVYLGNGRPQAEVDCVAATYEAWSLACHGSLDLSRYPVLKPYLPFHIQALPDGRWVNLRPLGTTLMAAPFVAPLALVRQEPLSPVNMLHLGKLVAACSVAGAVAVFFLAVRRLAPRAAWPASILLGLGTCLWSVASQALWMHGPATFWVCVALYCLLPTPDREEPGRGALALAGLALGMAFLTRPTAVFFLAASAVFLLSRKRWRSTVVLGLAASGPVLLYLLQACASFGNPLVGGYARDNWHLATPLTLGATGLLIAPSRGLFVYSPALLLMLGGAWIAWRRRHLLGGRPLASFTLCWLAAALVTVLFYGRWYEWRGGWCYGPRFLCETMPICCLLFALCYAELGTSWARAGALALVGLSVAVHLVGVAGRRAHVPWHERHPHTDQGRSLFSLDDTQIAAHTRATLDKLTRLSQPAK